LEILSEYTFNPPFVKQFVVAHEEKKQQS
jgi:hypothetical protein